VENRYPNCLPYRSPLFEVNALRWQGRFELPAWLRRGDLVVLNKESVNSVPKARPFVARTGRRPGRALLGSVATTAVLPSVGSRNKLRKRANVVTHRNRFLSVRSVDDLFAYLTAIRDTGDGAHQRQSFKKPSGDAESSRSRTGDCSNSLIWENSRTRAFSSWSVATPKLEIRA
jgi:hypothetical protein